MRSNVFSCKRASLPKSIGGKYAALVRQWQRQAHFSHETAYAGPMIVEDARRILELRGKIRALEGQMRHLGR